MVFLPISTISQNNSKSEKYVSFEVFLIKNFRANQNTYLDSSSKIKRKLKHYFKNKKTIKSIPDSLCVNYIDLENVEIKEDPLLSIDDILYYDKEMATIVLSHSGIEIIENFKPELFGTPCGNCC
jgi:hypothetical protein